jgi:hypothetical protein
MTEFFGRNVKQQVLPTRVVFADRLCEIPTGCTEFALWSAELLKQQICEAGVRRGNTHRVLKALVMYKHGVLL